MRLTGIERASSHLISMLALKAACDLGLVGWQLQSNLTDPVNVFTPREIAGSLIAGSTESGVFWG